MALIVSSATTQGCATPNSAGATEEIGNGAQERAVRDFLLFGPGSFDRLNYRLLWAVTAGLVTVPVWLPWMIYEAAAVGLANRGLNTVVEVRVREGRVLIEGNRGPIGQEVWSESAIPSNFDFGRYHALVVGNDEYQHLKELVTAVNDAEQISSLLQDSYGFETTLVKNATRGDLISTLFKFRESMGAKDNLLIYYAGHGLLDPDTNEGYWLPIDAREDDPSQWIANSEITTMLKGIAAKHIIVIADSCFAGSLNRSTSWTSRDRNFVSRMAAKRSRVVMTSGGLEPVVDSGNGENSVFATYLLQVLRENSGVIDSNSLFLKIRKPVVENAYQTPEYGPIRFTGHEGGDFLFVRKIDASAD